MTLAIEHDRRAQRFQTRVDGHVCELDYTVASAVMTITHTGVPAAVGGRGIAGALVQAALDAARAEAWQVQPQCPYAARWIERHPAYQDLLA